MEILDVMAQAIPEPRKEVSKYAPKIETFNVDPEKLEISLVKVEK